jgi:hypothetical protein
MLLQQAIHNTVLKADAVRYGLPGLIIIITVLKACGKHAQPLHTPLCIAAANAAVSGQRLWCGIEAYEQHVLRAVGRMPQLHEGMPSGATVHI